MVDLLAKHREPHAVVERDVIAVGVRGPEAVDAAGFQPLIRLDLVQQLLRVFEQLTCSSAMRGVVENRWVLALQLPRVEEERPVDVLAQLRDLRLDDLCAGEWWFGQVGKRKPQSLGASFVERQQRAPGRRVLRAQLFLQREVVAFESLAALGVEQV